MLHSPVLIPPSASFWQEAARALLRHPLTAEWHLAQSRDFSALRIVVPTFVHAQLLRKALAAELQCAFIPPRITTMPVWLSSLPLHAPVAAVASDSERLMALYAELRQHGWLKKLFSARRNTDLMPLAQTLLALSDELTQNLLPQLRLAPAAVAQRWQAALAQLAPAARDLVSDEAQLVWSIWRSQLEGNDAIAARFTQMMHLAAHADAPLLWMAPLDPDVFDQAFLNAYGTTQAVLQITLDWRRTAIEPAFATAWQELAADPAHSIAEPIAQSAAALPVPSGLALCAATSGEDEAVQAAQTIVDWLRLGKSSIAIVAQDRVAARRIRALLERAQVLVADETGWKLSTTRAAAAVAAWFDVVASNAETAALLDLLKSPFLFADVADKSAQLMRIESTLRNGNVPGGWHALKTALAALPQESATLAQIARHAGLFTGRKTVAGWLAVTGQTVDALGMRDAFAADAAGQQVMAMFDALAQDCGALAQPFSIAEWRALVNLQLESTVFVPPASDRRVVMLPLNGARLRRFDAVLLVGADARHLPSQPNETLFFSNAVRRELGLATRESLQRQQLRDFAELLSTNPEVVLSWQTHRDGEPNPVSPWVERLQLALARSGAQRLPSRRADIALRVLAFSQPTMPAPAAPQLLPAKLSASGYNSLFACPYQFFATRMLGLSGLDELTDMPEKRDYGDWLHQILKIYHDTIRSQPIDAAGRETVLRDVSEKIFGAALDRNAAALGYYMRWQKVIPAYLAWANERETQGWYFDSGERRFERPLQWQDGGILLHGRIDRVDANDAGEHAVLDYKTKNKADLVGRLKKLEDHQLPFYGLLSDVPIDAAHYVALESTKDKTGDVAAPRYGEWQHMLAARIAGDMQAIAHGAALPATGVESVCRFCDVRGLCRKGAW